LMQTAATCVHPSSGFGGEQGHHCVWTDLCQLFDVVGISTPFKEWRLVHSKMGNCTMFFMVSSFGKQVAPRADQYLGNQFANHC